MKELLQPAMLHDYQRTAVMHQLSHDDSMLWLQMGLGKTPITLTTIVDRMRAGQVKKTLIFGPLRVIQAVWARESRKWSHTNHLRFSVIHGNKEKRTRALFADADIFLVNYENMNWLAETLDHYYTSQGRDIPFQMVVYDEVSKLKNSTTKRMAGGKRDRRDGQGNTYEVKVTGWRKFIDMFKYRTGLTGTPASNGYLDLHGQFLAVDGGERLGPYITHFKDSYFVSDYNGWNYSPSDLGKNIIEGKISDITLKMDAADYLDMPACKVTNMLVDLPPKARKAYLEMERDMYTALDSGGEFEVFSKSSVSNKCLQFCLAEGTEVLTDSGWKPIEQFKKGDKVWDGCEWANVYSLAFQGVKDVIELDGVWMTPDHRVLTVSGWKEAEEILAGGSSDRFNRAKVRLPDCVEKVRVNRHESEKSNVASSMCRGERIQSCWSKLNKPEQTWCKVLRLSTWGNNTECHGFSRNGQNQTVHRVDKHAVTMQERKGQRLPELWCEGHRCMRQMVQQFRQLLVRYGVNIPTSFNDRKGEQQRRVSRGELQVGDTEPSVEQQVNKSLHRHTIGENDSYTSGSALRVQRRDTVCENTQRVGGRRPAATRRVEKTYDLINAGKRSRFTVRGANGEVFIAHNCNGSPYRPIIEGGPVSQEFEALHDAKLDALEEVLESAGGAPVLCSYTFKSDAERIMKKFKKYRPVNLTKTKSADTERVINDWNAGKVKLLIGHPACLHADTRVLTQWRGWVRIVDIEDNEKVWDGVEFVSHSGCSYSGYKEVIDMFGMTMTPDHKLLVGGEWVEASHVRDCGDTKRKALYQYQGDDKYLSEMLTLRDCIEDTPPECNETQQTETGRKKEHVYDLVDCGPRHRFVIKNDAGEVFISHNSMGHGVDGLQDSGSIIVWFGLNWSLELYEQMNGRLNRQGQTAPVSVIHILCRDSVDLAVADALERKTDDQDGLKNALQRYRDGHITNDLTVNFF